MKLDNKGSAILYILGVIVLLTIYIESNLSTKSNQIIAHELELYRMDVDILKFDIEGHLSHMLICSTSLNAIGNIPILGIDTNGVDFIVYNPSDIAFSLVGPLPPGQILTPTPIFYGRSANNPKGSILNSVEILKLSLRIPDNRTINYLNQSQMHSKSAVGLVTIETQSLRNKNLKLNTSFNVDLSLSLEPLNKTFTVRSCTSSVENLRNGPSIVLPTNLTNTSLDQILIGNAGKRSAFLMDGKPRNLTSSQYMTPFAQLHNLCAQDWGKPCSYSQWVQACQFLRKNIPSDLTILQNELYLSNTIYNEPLSTSASPLLSNSLSVKYSSDCNGNVTAYPNTGTPPFLQKGVCCYER